MALSTVLVFLPVFVPAFAPDFFSMPFISSRPSVLALHQSSLSISVTSLSSVAGFLMTLLALA